MQKIGFIGAGNMATAIILGILKSELSAPENIYAYDLIKEKCDMLKAKGINICKDEAETVSECDLIFLAVKPQNYIDTISHISKVSPNGKIFISLAAGISTQYIEELYGQECSVIRVMPNTPLLIGKGATAVCRNERVNDEQFKAVCDIFSSSGIVEVMDQQYLNSVICVNGSSPAYVYLLAKAMIDSAVLQGIDRDVAANLVYQTILGSAQMLIESGKQPQQLIDMVTSPGGTTLASMQSFEKDDFCGMIDRAMKACTKRALELGK